MTPPSPVSLCGAAAALVVQDVLRSVEHYRDVLGFHTEFTYGQPTFYAGVERNGVVIHLQAASSTKRQPGHGAVNVFVTDVDAPSRGPRQAHLQDFEHQLARPVVPGRLQLQRDAAVAPQPQPLLRERWAQDISAQALQPRPVVRRHPHVGVQIEPLEFLERLAAMTPRPETNLLICHGLLAPRARRRERVVAYGRVAPEPTALAPPLAAGPDSTGVKSSLRAWTWAALMHRAFAIDVLACVHCGGRLRLIATLHDPAVIRKLLAHLGMARSVPSPGPAPPEAGAGAR